MSSALLMTLAVLFDWRLGEPRRRHPLVGFGRLAGWLERRLYRPARLNGALAWALAVLPLAALAGWLESLPWFGPAFAVWALYFALGHKSLHDHLLPVADSLEAGDEAGARALVARVVSRDAEALEIAPSAVESALENGNDGVFGALFWFAVAGAPGAILYRLANTLDAMWGYRDARYGRFGWAAARADDLLNYLPARFSALTYALLGRTGPALAAWRGQAAAWDGVNPGVVMATGAGALEVRLGGPARYGGAWHDRPALGSGAAPGAADIRRALALVRHGVVLWLAVAALAEVAHA